MAFVKKIFDFLSFYNIFIALIAVISALVGANMFITCPAYYDGDFEQCHYPIYFASFALFEMIINLILFHYCTRFNRVEYIVPLILLRQKSQEYQRSFLSPSSDEMSKNNNENVDTMQGVVKPKYCAICKIVVPQRCHHCRLCDYCVVNRDHHCHITAGCVGFANQRYFVVFLFWASLNSALGFSFLIRYLNKFYVPFLPFGFVEYFMMPISFYKWIYAETCTTLTFFLVSLFFIGYMVTGCAAVYCSTQSYMILNNIKTRDLWKSRNNKENNKNHWVSYRQCLNHIFGPFWFLNFIFPMPFKNELDDNLKTFIIECHKKNAD